MRQIRAREMLGHLMKSANLSTRDLARQAKGNKDSINRLVSGQQSICRDDLADRIESALGVPEGSLFLAVRLSRTVTPVARRSAA